MFFDRIQGNPTMDTLTNPPTIFTPTVYYGTLDSLRDSAGGGVLAPSTISSLIGAVKMPTVYNFSFGLQQQIGKATILDISYAGSLSRNFLWKRNINAVPPGAQYLDQHPENKDPTRPTSALSTNFLRPYQGYADINMYEFGSTANYNSLQASSTKRFRQGYIAAVVYLQQSTSAPRHLIPPR